MQILSLFTPENRILSTFFNQLKSSGPALVLVLDLLITNKKWFSIDYLYVVFTILSFKMYTWSATSSTYQALSAHFASGSRNRIWRQKALTNSIPGMLIALAFLATMWHNQVTSTPNQFNQRGLLSRIRDAPVSISLPLTRNTKRIISCARAIHIY